MDWLVPVALSLSLIAVIFLLIWLGWRGRTTRQSAVGPLPELPADPGPQICAIEGQYVVTTSSGDWLDRIAVHGLGVKSNATASVHPTGVHVARTGAPDLFIPIDALDDVHFASGMAGKFVEKDGLVVIRWLLGTKLVDTGFRTRRAAERNTLRDAIHSLRQEEGQL